MTLPVYPGPDLLPGLKYSSKWSPAFLNMPTATTASGADIDLALAQYPLHDFELSYEFLRDSLSPSEFRTLMGFFLQLGGTVGRFLFDNPDDNQVTANPIGTGDGSNKIFTLTRFFGANGYGASEPVGVANTSATFNVYNNGSLVSPSAYTVDTSLPCANTVTFTTAPASGHAITVDMSYRYYCKLADNAATFEKFMNQLWSVEKITLHSCRAGA